ncbi:SDR family oxidoreductase [Massilia sp. LXY-6]|uniref:SDR family oxidoreductase n=1 Tax=Massilia sp. LXY-6 TaxID=3379823 RepID=UPI003EE3ED3A
MSVAPQRVFITGASSGIGAALAREYAARGAVLGLLARRRDALDALVATLPHPERHRVYALDVTDHAALAGAANDFIGAHGGADVVIASAGISHGTLTERLEDLPLFESVFATNVQATIATFAPFIAAMKEGAGARRLVAIGSVGGVRGMKGAGAYCASKAAVHSYCESLRLEMRPYGIRVVTIAPGYIDTPMTSNNRFPMPFLMPAGRFAARAVGAIEAGTSFRVIPWQMGLVARLLRVLPNAIFDALFARAPQKARKEAA